MAAAGWITWIIANQLVDVASQLPTYRQNIHAKIEALRNRGKGPLGRAADTAKDIGQELSRPDAPAIAPTPPVRNQKERNTPKTPAPPVPVQIVQTRTNGLADLPDLLKPFLAPYSAIVLPSPTLARKSLGSKSGGAVKVKAVTQALTQKHVSKMCRRRCIHFGRPSLRARNSCAARNQSFSGDPSGQPLAFHSA